MAKRIAIIVASVEGGRAEQRRRWPQRQGCRRTSSWAKAQATQAQGQEKEHSSIPQPRAKAWEDRHFRLHGIVHTVGARATMAPGRRAGSASCLGTRRRSHWRHSSRSSNRGSRGNPPCSRSRHSSLSRPLLALSSGSRSGSRQPRFRTLLHRQVPPRRSRRPGRERCRKSKRRSIRSLPRSPRSSLLHRKTRRTPTSSSWLPRTNSAGRHSWHRQSSSRTHRPSSKRRRRITMVHSRCLPTWKQTRPP